ncbi:hypothetical protein JT321_gp66 [Providencia phage Kokobel1]|uniref:Uncharacterized protein n=1 Tax=Providencia phage Kokobel1 TaxID=2783540 RepID=A0A873WGB3_9CAUD|nr:hypothetical protein JT321_gp66 [Providencia phage Kokobel1]QPB11493.1 hypothetical protein [Providencia phage Kokobel1]
MKHTNVAIAIDAAMTRSKVNMATIFKSLERDYKMNIKASWCGIEAFTPERRIYAHGEYAEKGAATPEQRTRYRIRLIRFVKWLFSQNYITPEMEAARSWFEDQDEW